MSYSLGAAGATPQKSATPQKKSVQTLVSEADAASAQQLKKTNASKFAKGKFASLTSRPITTLMQAIGPFERSMARVVAAGIRMSSPSRKIKVGKNTITVDMRLKQASDSKLDPQTRQIVRRLRILAGFYLLAWTSPATLTAAIGKAFKKKIFGGANAAKEAAFAKALSAHKAAHEAWKRRQPTGMAAKVPGAMQAWLKLEPRKPERRSFGLSGYDTGASLMLEGMQTMDQRYQYIGEGEDVSAGETEVEVDPAIESEIPADVPPDTETTPQDDVTETAGAASALAPLLTPQIVSLLATIFSQGIMSVGTVAQTAIQSATGQVPPPADMAAQQDVAPAAAEEGGAGSTLMLLGAAAVAAFALSKRKK